MSGSKPLPGGTSRMSAETERLLARLVMDGAAQLAERASTQGVTAYLRKPLVRGRPNERFLQNTLRNLSTSNRRSDESLMWELRDSQRQREGRDSASPGGDLQASSSRSPPSSSAPSEQPAKQRRSKSKRDRSPRARSSKKRRQNASKSPAAEDEPGPSHTRSHSPQAPHRLARSEAAHVVEGDDTDSGGGVEAPRGAGISDALEDGEGAGGRRKQKRRHKHRAEKRGKHASKCMDA